MITTMINSIFKSGCPEGYLQDQSGLIGSAEAIAFVISAQQAASALAEAARFGQSVTVQGARTGINGGAVPMGGLVINLSRMNGFISFEWDESMGAGRICVQAGVTLEQLEHALASKSVDQSGFDHQSRAAWTRYSRSSELLEFAPNPSEKTATLGGMVACAATGPRVGIGMFFEHVAGAEAVFADGTILRLDSDAMQDEQELLAALFGAVKAHSAPKTHPFEAGFAADEGPIALLCGSEGILAIITQITLRLTAVRGQTHGVLIPLESVAQMMNFWRAFWSGVTLLSEQPLLSADCFDPSCALLVRRASMAQRAGDVLTGFDAAGSGPVLLLQIRTQREESLFDALELVLSCLVGAGVADDKANVASDTSQLSSMMGIQHRVVETACLLSAGKTCLAAELCVPEERFERVFSQLSGDLTDGALLGMLMGDLLTGQLSVRLLPFSADEEAAAETLYACWLEEWAAEGCSCSGKYGIGRIKKRLFGALSKEQAALARTLRALADPKGLINPGVVVDVSGDLRGKE